MTLGLNPDRKVETLVHATGGVSMEGVVSRDGRWLAYTNVESGIPQIVVVALSNPSGERTQVMLTACFGVV